MRKGHAWFQTEPVISKGLGQDITAFQAEVAIILDCMTSCLRKKLVKEQITICTDRQVAVATLGASGTRSLLEVGCVEKLTAL